MAMTPILQATHISKSFAGVPVLDEVSLTLEGGTIHALMGENGAGKSTFMNILMGMFPPDSGEILIKGQPVHFSSAREALRHGIAMIHQELLVFPDLTVAENVFMGREPVKGFGWIDRNTMNREAKALLAQLELDIPVTAKMKELSIGQMQMVEIAKALSNQATVLIMDEPTSAISQREAEILFKTMFALKEQGKAIIYISHKMDEIYRLADTITVLRDGKYMGTKASKDLPLEELINLIVGRELQSFFNKQVSHLGELVLEMKNIYSPALTDISLQLRKGEILGIAGLMGAGRTNIAHVLAGLEKPSSGEILLNGKAVQIDDPKAAIRHGIGLVTEDRKQYGLVLEASVRNNITLSSLKKHGSGIFLDPQQENEIADREISRFRIKTASRQQAVGRLSGGNQQKVVIAGMYLNDPDIIILDEPTRGVDVGAKQEIYEFVAKLVEAGKAVILISSELPEILALSDRILVVREGKIKAELGREQASQELIMHYAMID
jgi:inositol transport system ATP-binding protein